MREPESLVSVQAVGANVLIRAMFSSSIINIQNAKDTSAVDIHWQVASVGSEVRDEISLRDFVVLHSQPQVPCYVPENKFALNKVRTALLDDVKNDDLRDLMKMTTKLDLWQYFLVPESYIVGITQTAFIATPNIDAIMEFIDSCGRGVEIEEEGKVIPILR